MELAGQGPLGRGGPGPPGDGLEGLGFSLMQPPGGLPQHLQTMLAQQQQQQQQQQQLPAALMAGLSGLQPAGAGLFPQLPPQWAQQQQLQQQPEQQPQQQLDQQQPQIQLPAYLLGQLQGGGVPAARPPTSPSQSAALQALSSGGGRPSPFLTSQQQQGQQQQQPGQQPQQKPADSSGAAAAAAAATNQAGQQAAAQQAAAAGAAGAGGLVGGGQSGSSDPVSVEYNRYLRLLPPLIQQRFQGNLLRQCVHLQQQGLPLAQAQRTVQQQQLQEMHKIAQEIMQQRLREWSSGGAAAATLASRAASLPALSAGAAGGGAAAAAQLGGADAARSSAMPTGWGANGANAGGPGGVAGGQGQGLPAELLARAGLQQAGSPAPGLLQQQQQQQQQPIAARAASLPSSLWHQQAPSGGQFGPGMGSPGADLLRQGQAQRPHSALPPNIEGLLGMAGGMPGADAAAQRQPSLLSQLPELPGQQQAQQGQQAQQPGGSAAAGPMQGLPWAALGLQPPAAAGQVPAAAGQLGSPRPGEGARGATAQFIAQLQQEQQQYTQRLMVRGEGGGGAAAPQQQPQEPPNALAAAIAAMAQQGPWAASGQQQQQQQALEQAAVAAALRTAAAEGVAQQQQQQQHGENGMAGTGPAPPVATGASEPSAQTAQQAVSHGHSKDQSSAGGREEAAAKDGKGVRGNRRCARCKGQYAAKCDWTLCAKCCREAGNDCPKHGRKDGKKRQQGGGSGTPAPTAFLLSAQSLPSKIGSGSKGGSGPGQQLPDALPSGLLHSISGPPSLEPAGRQQPPLPLAQQLAGGVAAAAMAAAAPAQPLAGEAGEVKVDGGQGGAGHVPRSSSPGVPLGSSQDAARTVSLQLRLSQPLVLTEPQPLGPQQAGPAAAAQQAQQAMPTFRGVVLPGQADPSAAWGPQGQLRPPSAAAQWQQGPGGQGPGPQQQLTASLHTADASSAGGPQAAAAALQQRMAGGGAAAGSMGATPAAPAAAAGAAAGVAAGVGGGGMVDLVETLRAVQRENEDIALWRHAVCKRNAAITRQQVVDAVERYKWNAAMLAELFDGTPVDEAPPIAMEFASVSKLAHAAAPAPGEAVAQQAQQAQQGAAAAGQQPVVMAGPGLALLGAPGVAEQGPGLAAVGADAGGEAHPAAAAGGGTEGQRLLAAAMRRLGGVDALRAAATDVAAAALPAAPADPRARQLWQQQQWLQGMSEPKRQRLADVALHIQRGKVAGGFNRACGAAPVPLPPDFDAAQLLQHPGRTVYRL